jgi:hypothetical protein
MFSYAWKTNVFSSGKNIFHLLGTENIKKKKEQKKNCFFFVPKKNSRFFKPNKPKKVFLRSCH